MPAPGIQSIESEDMDFNQFGPENCQPGSSTQFLSSTAAAEAEKQMLMKQGFTPQGLSHILSNTKKRNMSVKTEYRECKKKFKFLVYVRLFFSLKKKFLNIVLATRIFSPGKSAL